MQLKSVEALKSETRNSAIDFYRGIAIIIVVFHHYGNYISFGNIGVDLFFVISGVLVSDILIKLFKNDEKINFFKFFLQRGFKIWPSFYFFLAFGGILTYLMYSEIDPNQIIPLHDLKRYLLFYQNYTGQPFHWSFDHIWSLCVEEHFYILLPLFFIICAFLRFNFKTIIILVVVGIIAGIGFKFCSYHLTNSQDTYSATHNRIDALLWGVLFQLIISYYPNFLKNLNNKHLLTLIGVLICVSSILLVKKLPTIYFEKVLYHSFVPVGFFLMLIGTYNINFKKFFPISFIAYYSYNWYLWHHVFVIYFMHRFDKTLLGLFLYVLFTFVFSMLTTILIEENALKYRTIIINRIFPK